VSPFRPLRRLQRSMRMLLSTDAFRSFAVAFAVIVAVVAASCDKIPLTSPTGSTISLAIDRSIVPVNGQATVIATVIESAGTAVHNGTTVSFTTTIGSISPFEAQTINGRATVTYIAPSVSGTAVINAFSGAASTTSGNSSAGGVSVMVGSAAVGTGGVTVNVAPATVSQNGGTVIVSARVLDTGNNPLGGVAVIFATDQGTLGSTSVVTDSSGSASTTLTTNRVTKVSATVGAQKGEFTVNVVTAPTVTITVGSGTATAGSPVAFTVTPTATATGNPIASVLVEFGDGHSQTLGAINGPVGLTHTYERAGGYTAIATAIDINGARGVGSVGVVVGFAPLPTASITATPNPVPASANGLTAFTVTAGPATSGPPLRTVRVTLGDGTVIYNGTGPGSFTYRFGGSGTYVATVTATDANGYTGQGSTVVVVNP
jgi:hypothetical protein